MSKPPLSDERLNHLINTNISRAVSGLANALSLMTFTEGAAKNKQAAYAALREINVIIGDMLCSLDGICPVCEGKEDDVCLKNGTVSCGKCHEKETEE